MRNSCRAAFTLLLRAADVLDFTLVQQAERIAQLRDIREEVRTEKRRRSAPMRAPDFGLQEGTRARIETAYRFIKDQ